jgi:hypothetical protein
MTRPTRSVDAGSPDGVFTRPLTLVDAIAPLLVSVGVTVALSFAYRPYFAEALAAMLPPGADMTRVAAIHEQVFRFSLIGSVVLPVAYPTITATVAFLVLAAIPADDMPRFSALLACAAWAALLLRLKDLSQYLVIYARGLDAVHDAFDLRPGVGLGFLLEDRDSIAYELLDLVNGFDVGYLAAFSLAIGRAARVPPAPALAAAALPWALLHAIRIGFGMLIPR